jgi:GAF domain-containing protein
MPAILPPPGVALRVSRYHPATIQVSPSRWCRAACVNLQLYDRHARVLRLVAQRGFSSRFLAFFATVGVAQPTACAAAFASCRPVLVDDVTRSAIFVGQPTMEPMLDAGSRTVHSYPLLASPEDVVGVLSFHYRERAPEPGAVELVVHSAARVVAQVPRDAFPKAPRNRRG